MAKTPSRKRFSSILAAGSRAETAISPVVRVPVLSRQRVSTRASSSMDASSWHSASRPAKRTTPTASTTLVRRISPSGIIPTSAATVRTTASLGVAWTKNHCLTNRAAPTGRITAAITRMMRSMVFRISESGRFQRFPPAAIWAA